MLSQKAFLYDLDERPPSEKPIYGVQCAVLMLPTLTILSALAGAALQLTMPDRLHWFSVCSWFPVSS